MRDLLRRALTGASLCAALVSPIGSGVQADEWDPIEPVNRVSFAINDGLDLILIKPLAQGWAFVLRDPGVAAVDRFFVNLRFPVRLVGNLLQAELVHSTEETGRFVVNTTVGLLGFFDPASRLGIGLYEEDIGQAIGRWGIPAGPYLVVPLLGPSGGRDFFTGFADSALLGPASIAESTIGNINLRAQLLDEVEEAKLASLDYYAFVRNAYVTTRQAAVENRDPEEEPDEIDDDLYEIDEDYE